MDNNGQSEIIGFCLLTSEDLENVANMALSKDLILRGKI